MKTRGFITIVAVAGLLVTAAATPAAAADAPVVSATGLTDGELVGRVKDFTPIISDDAVRVQVVVPGRFSATVPWPNSAVRAEFPADLDGKDADVTVRAFNETGDSSALTTRVRVDGKAPKLSFRTPLDGGVVHGQTALYLTPDADDVAEIVMNAPDGTELARVTSKPWVINYDFTGHDGRVTFRATDKLGNVSEIYEAAFVVDEQGPTIALAAPPVTRPGKHWIGARVDDATSVAKMEWHIDGAPRGNAVAVEYDFGTQIRAVPVEIRAWDPWGNATTETFSIQVDNTGPVVTRVSPGHLALVRGTSLTTTLTATDPAGLDTAYLSAPLNVTGQRTGTTFSAPLKLGRDGATSFTWVVRDYAGNPTSYYRTVVVDNTLPKITSVTAPASGATVPATVKTAMTATDLNGIARAELRVNGTLVLSDSKAPYNLNLDATKYGKSFTVAWYALDKAGNLVSTSRRTWKR
ncbi:Ig-like domain-containing protein [Actinoplanes sp. NPDC089786]|uniref:Ig-like domain-containing protein n=1 Tax=Actinoplanes sp. NPDC089786 TaxID=3155185 RepID=UPI003419CDFC